MKSETWQPDYVPHHELCKLCTYWLHHQWQKQPPQCSHVNNTIFISHVYRDSHQFNSWTWQCLNNSMPSAMFLQRKISWHQVEMASIRSCNVCKRINVLYHISIEITCHSYRCLMFLEPVLQDIFHILTFLLKHIPVYHIYKNIISWKKKH